MGEFAHDAITLAELQVELAKVDLHEFGRHLLLPATLIVTAGTLLLGCVTAALLSLAAGLVELGVSLWLALLISAGCGLTLAAAMIGLAWRRLCRARSPFHGSTGELKQNLAWIKQMLKHRGINH